MIRYGGVADDFTITPRPPSQAGVYLFLGPQDRIMYVGMAHNLEAVLYRYKGLKGRQRMRDRRANGLFSRVAWIACSQAEAVASLERVAITRLRPPWNDQHNSRPYSEASAAVFDDGEQAWLELAESQLSTAVTGLLAN